MHRVFHRNVARIFGYHVVPEKHLGYIIMEYVEGETIDNHLKTSPENLNSVFRQTIAAFCHLEECGILHRDLRYQNVLVSSDGVVKVIDLGFGKAVTGLEDFSKSITLNWAFTPPREFANGTYDFQSEVYFVGKLFEHIMSENGIDDERVASIVRGMCVENPARRTTSFRDVQLGLDRAVMSGPEFDFEDVVIYRRFADDLSGYVTEIEANTKNITEPSKVIGLLERAYEKSMLEDSVEGSRIAYCFLTGEFKVTRKNVISVEHIKDFLALLKRSAAEAQRIIMANLFARLDSKKRYTHGDDEIPF